HSIMLSRLMPLLCLFTSLASQSTTESSIDKAVERLLNETNGPPLDGMGSLQVAISNPWVRSEKLEHGFGNASWTSKSVVPRLFADMGRGGFPPIETVMKWSCWNGVEEKTKEEFREIFNENNTIGMVKRMLDEWIFHYNGTEIAEKIQRNRDDFESRMKLFSINFESALSTLSTAVRTFNDVARDDEMTIGQANTVLNSIADVLDKNFVKSLNHLFHGNVMNGKKLQKMIEKAVTTTKRPSRITAPSHWGNNTGNGVWNGNWKRYTVVRRVTRKPDQMDKTDNLL
ncbi:hypothetical protein PENTCL1PPCAC_17536, partial [Pristionchus entomophagus]